LEKLISNPETSTETGGITGKRQVSERTWEDRVKVRKKEGKKQNRVN